MNELVHRRRQEVDERQPSREGARESSAGNPQGAYYAAQKPTHGDRTACRSTGTSAYYEVGGFCCIFDESEVGS